MNKVFTHVKNLNESFADAPFYVAKKGTSHYISILTSSGYKIYDCKKLNVIFQGPLIETPLIIKMYNEYVIVYNKKLTFYYRGVSAYEKEELVDDIVVFGTYIISVHDSRISINNIDILSDYNVKLELMHYIDRNSIIKVLHPPTYVNKIVIVYRNEIEIYNIKKQKTVHKAELENCCNAFLTPVLDIVALQCGEEISFYNLRTDIVEFKLSCSKDLKHLSFSSSQPLMLSINKDDMWAYNLEERRVVKRYDEKAIHATFLCDEDIIAISTKNVIKLVTIEDYNLKLLKIRRTLDNAKFMEIQNNKIVVGSKKEVFYIDICKEEQNFAYSIKNYKGASNVTIESDSIVVYDQSNIYCLDSENRNGISIIESYKENLKNVTISSCGNFSALITQTNNIVIYNLSSKMVYGSHKKEDKVISAYLDTFRNSIIIFYQDKIEFCNQKFVEIAKIRTENINYAKCAGNFVIIQNFAKVVFYDVFTQKIARCFETTDEIVNFNVSDDLSLLIILTNTSLLVYDIKTTQKIEEIITKCDYALMSKNNEFLCILKGGVINCYYNNTFFDNTLLLNKKPLSLPKEQCIETQTLSINSFDDLLQSDIFKSYTLLGPEKFNRLICSNVDGIDMLYSYLIKYLPTRFEELQLVLHEILKLTHKSISKETGQRFYDEFISIYDKVNTEYTKAIAYTKFENLKL